MIDTKSTKTDEQILEYVRDYVAYILTSAKGLYREPASYGPMRIIDSMDRALGLLQELGLKDEKLEKALSSVRRERWRAMNDPQGFAKAMDESILQLVKLSR